jgi:hypothetical protein
VLLLVAVHRCGPFVLTRLLLLCSCTACRLQDFTKEERVQLAAKSRAEPPKFGSAGRQKVIDDMHARFLEVQRKAAAAAAGAGSSSSASSPNGKAVAAAAGAAVAAVGAPRPSDDAAAVDQGAAGAQLPSNAGNSNSEPQQQRDVFRLSESSRAQQQQAPQVQQVHAQVQAPPLLVGAGSGGGGVGVASVPGELPGDRGLTFLAVVLSVAIVAMLLKKFILAIGGDVTRAAVL